MRSLANAWTPLSDLYNKKQQSLRYQPQSIATNNNRPFRNQNYMNDLHQKYIENTACNHTKYQPKQVRGQTDHVKIDDEVLGRRGSRRGGGGRSVRGHGHQLVLESLDLVRGAGAANDGVAAPGQLEGKRPAEAAAHPSHQHRLPRRRFCLHPRRCRHPLRRRRRPRRRRSRTTHKPNSLHPLHQPERAVQSESRGLVSRASFIVRLRPLLGPNGPAWQTQLISVITEVRYNGMNPL